MNETIMHDLVTKHVPRLDDLKRTTRDRFCSYDAYNDHVIVEYKSRRKFYEGSTQLELPKYEKNMSDKRQYLYVVFDGVDKIQIWNVTKLDQMGYDFKWTQRLCPETTDFDRKEMVHKDVGELAWKDAHHTLQLKARENPVEKPADTFDYDDMVQL